MNIEARNLHKCNAVIGHRLRFREVKISDAPFILSLRLDESKNQHLSKVSDDLRAQENWLRACVADQGQLYFIIETLNGHPVGTVRLYDARGDLFSWGSWILTDQAPRSSAVESTLMVYHYGLSLGFVGAHFDVRRGNEKVWRYHERMGARRVRESADDYFYEIDRQAIEAAFSHYRARIPDGITIKK